MTPAEFIEKWTLNRRPEAAASKEHFNDLCALLGVPTPNYDPEGATYAFEKGASKAGGGRGWADVWRRDCFAWEYKSRGEDLKAAHVQLLRYAGSLENPPLLICSDMERIVIHTNWTGYVSEPTEFGLADLASAAVRDRLRALWLDKDRWKPTRTRAALTLDAAEEFAKLARSLRERGHDPQRVAHFVIRLAFCFFAEDTGLLPQAMMARLLGAAKARPGDAPAMVSELFRAMHAPGGRIGFDPVQWFNGGLFDNDDVLPLTSADIDRLQASAALRWDEIDPSILGTLFERGLDPENRTKLGAHYTDREMIERIVDPVVRRPLLAEWERARETIAQAMARRAELLKVDAEQAQAALDARAKATAVLPKREFAAIREAAKQRTRGATTLLAEAEKALNGFLARLRAFRVLDPACGSGNFLYVALLALKDLEGRAIQEAEALGLLPRVAEVGPEAVLGIELNPYAAELARVSAWIGHIQWARRNGYPTPENPVLRSLDTIDCRDAILARDAAGSPLPSPAADWPAVDVIIGNPPFLGNKKMSERLGAAYVDPLRAAYAGRVSDGADLVCYWFERAREAVAGSRATRAGLVATQSIRKGKSRTVLDRLGSDGLPIFEAWSDLEWALDGAAVRVSVVCFGDAGAEAAAPRLDGAEVELIHADLAAGEAMTDVPSLPENMGVCFMGCTPNGPFVVPGQTARRWLVGPRNANGRGNADVLRPWANGDAVLGRWPDEWIIDFNALPDVDAAAFFSAPYAHLEKAIEDEKAAGEGKGTERKGDDWWSFERSRPAMRSALRGLRRYIATPETSQHRVFVWLDASVLPDHQLFAFARSDDVTFGILQSRIHVAWTLRRGSRLGDGKKGGRPRYRNTTIFETFPFPEGMTPDLPPADESSNAHAAAIARAARALVRARYRWLYPRGLTRRMSDVIPGLPARRVPRDKAAEQELKSRTLTDLYNLRGTSEGRWLDKLHERLDAAVAAAYGWPATLTDAEVLAELKALALSRVAPAAEPPAAAAINGETPDGETPTATMPPIVAPPRPARRGRRSGGNEAAPRTG